LPLRIDRREIVWAGFLALDAVRAAPLQPAVRRYLERLGPDGCPPLRRG